MRSAAVLVGALISGCSFSIGGGGTDTVVDAHGDAPDGPIDAPADDAAIDGPPGPWLAGYTYRKPVQVAPGGTGTLNDFAVGILLAADSDLAAHATGGDIVITAADATTVLATELVSFRANGDLELWVRVPSLPLAATTSLFLYYGGPSAVTNPNAVWQASVRGVWHLSETSGVANDSTSRAHDLVQATPTMVPGTGAGIGPANRARVFDGVDDRIETPDPADGSLDFGSQSFSVSLWARATGSVGSYDSPLYKGGTTGTLPGYTLFMGSSAWCGKVHDGSNFVSPEFTTGPMLNQWVHVALVIDRSGTAAVRAYFNGVLTATSALTLGSLSSSQPLTIGAGSGGARFQGSIDEVRIYDRPLSLAWVATEYANLATPGFVTVLPQQMR